MAQPIFVDGMSFWKAHPKSPEYIKGKITIHPQKFAAWAAQHENALDRGWLSIDLKESGTTGNWYLALNDYKAKKEAEKDPAEPTNSEMERWANQETVTEENSSDIPF